MDIDFNIVAGVAIGMFVYNIFLKAIGNVLIRYFLKTDVVQKEKKSFQDKLKEKMKQPIDGGSSY